jgi:hypothetical protein
MKMFLKMIAGMLAAIQLNIALPKATIAQALAGVLPARLI